MAVSRSTTDLWLVAALAILTVVLYRRSRKSHLPYPPGPRKWPIIGNVFSMPGPEDRPWIIFKEWSKTYGSDIISVEVLGSHLVILNAHSTIREIMEKRSLNYSDRPRMPMINELQGWTWNFAFMPYGPEWKEHRKLFRQEVEFSGGRLHHPHALLAARRFIKHTTLEPLSWLQHLRHMAGLVVLSTAYGIDVKPHHDSFIEIAEKAQSAIAKGGHTGAYLVDFIPSLQYLPDWFPGAGFKKEAKEWSKWVTLLPDVGFQLAKKDYLAGTGKHCIAARVLDNIGGGPDHERKEKVLKNAL